MVPNHASDGNLTADGSRSYEWDADQCTAFKTLARRVSFAMPCKTNQNRLIEVKNSSGTSLASYQYVEDAPRWNYLSRRVARSVVSESKTQRWVYDGWNPLVKYENSSGAPAVYSIVDTYTWGLDLSGATFGSPAGAGQGAGGVGGLLMVKKGGNRYYPLYDGNGNIVQYVNDGATNVAAYEYDAFGNTAKSYGSMVNDFDHRFSTKPLDASTGFYYYGYRYYDPTTGRWPSRDPIEEEGGINLYGFVDNASVGQIDYLGNQVYGIGQFSDINTITRVDSDTKAWLFMFGNDECSEDDDVMTVIFKIYDENTSKEKLYLQVSFEVAPSGPPCKLQAFDGNAKKSEIISTNQGFGAALSVSVIGDGGGTLTVTAKAEFGKNISDIIASNYGLSIGGVLIGDSSGTPGGRPWLKKKTAENVYNGGGTKLVSARKKYHVVVNENSFKVYHAAMLRFWISGY